jgi:rhomboid protease GluP
MRKKSTGAILCPSCRKLISANAPVCIYCGRKNPGLWGYGHVLQKFFGSTAAVSPLIIGFCILVYIVSLMIDPSALLQVTNVLRLLSPSGEALDRLGMTGAYALGHGRWWTLITANYLHGGILHILFNMMWIRQIGPMVEEIFGSARTFILFTISGTAAYLISGLVGVDFTIGASASIFGLLGALIYYGRRRGGQFGTTVYRQVGMWTLTGFLFGFIMPGVNNWAHAGGFIFGYITAQWIGFEEHRRESQIHQLAALGLILLTFFSFLLAIFKY